MNKPFIVEFAGPPKSGKTTIIDRIKYQLPYTFSILKEVSLDSPVSKKKVLKYMEWSSNQLINKLIFADELIGKEIVMVDCGIVSQLALLRAFKEAKKIRAKENEYYNLIRTHLLMNLRRQDAIFYVRMNIEDELKRIKSYRFPDGFIVNRSFLSVLNKSYEETVSDIKVMKDLFKIKIFEINGLLSPEDNSAIIRKLLIREYKKHRK